MKYADRMCRLLSGGRHVASVAVLYDGEADWNGGNMPMQKVIRQLLENQIDLDIVCLDMLENLADYNGGLDGKKLRINGVEFDALIVGYTPKIPAGLASFIQRAGKFPVLFVDGRPSGVVGQIDGAATAELERCETVALDQLAQVLKARGFVDVVSDTAFKDLSFYHYDKGRQIFVFQNESASEVYQGKVTLPTGKAVVYYDAMEDTCQAAQWETADGLTVVSLELEPGECVVLIEQDGAAVVGEHKSFRQQVEGLACTDISTGWQVSMVKAREYPSFPEGAMAETLVPISDQKPSFAGIIRYEKTVAFDEAPVEAYLRAEHIYEVMRVTVNGQDAGARLFPLYQVEIGKYLRAGENTITVEVATTPAREMLEIPQPPFDFSHEALEPSGMFGSVSLLHR